MQFSPSSRHNKRVTCLLATSPCHLVGGALFAPDADAHGWRHHHGWSNGDSDAMPPASSTSYHPGTPLGPVGSAAEDAKCDAGDLCTGEDRDKDGRHDDIKDDVSSPVKQTSTTTVKTGATSPSSSTSSIRRMHSIGST